MILLAAALAICPPTGVRVTCVHDGDSVVVERERIRIADIDTPELNGKMRGRTPPGNPCPRSAACPLEQ